MAYLLTNLAEKVKFYNSIFSKNRFVKEKYAFH